MKTNAIVETIANLLERTAVELVVWYSKVTI